MRNTLVHANSVVLKRMINAWTMGAQEQYERIESFNEQLPCQLRQSEYQN